MISRSLSPASFRSGIHPVDPSNPVILSIIRSGSQHSRRLHDIPLDDGPIGDAVKEPLVAQIDPRICRQ